MKTLVVIIVLALGALFMWLTVPSHAASGCGQLELFRAALKKNYNEIPNKIGVAGQNMIVELYLSPEKTWTILITGPTGLTCVVAAGRGWEDAKAEIEGKPL
jgi:hypothetical protein